MYSEVVACLSPRVAPPMFGVGLLEQIHPGDILANADPDDADGDGISGKPSMVRDPATGELALGRFGWKASTPTVRAQSADAFAGDIGISTPDVTGHYGDCTGAQAACRDAPSGVQERLGPVEAPPCAGSPGVLPLRSQPRRGAALHTVFVPIACMLFPRARAAPGQEVVTNYDMSRDERSHGAHTAALQIARRTGT